MSRPDTLMVELSVSAARQSNLLATPKRLTDALYAEDKEVLGVVHIISMPHVNTLTRCPACIATRTSAALNGVGGIAQVC